MPEPMVNMTSNDRQSDPGDWYAVYTRHQHETTVMNRLGGTRYGNFSSHVHGYPAAGKIERNTSHVLSFLVTSFCAVDPRQHFQVITTPGSFHAHDGGPPCAHTQ